MPILLVSAGLLCVAVALLHGYLGETKLIAPANFPNRQARLLVGAVWQLSTATWVVSGIVIAASPWLFREENRPWGVAAACLPLVYGAVANAWITRGRHFGWKALAVVVFLGGLGAIR